MFGGLSWRGLPEGIVHVGVGGRDTAQQQSPASGRGSRYFPHPTAEREGRGWPKSSPGSGAAARPGGSRGGPITLLWLRSSPGLQGLQPGFPLLIRTGLEWGRVWLRGCPQPGFGWCPPGGTPPSPTCSRASSRPRWAIRIRRFWGDPAAAPGDTSQPSRRRAHTGRWAAPGSGNMRRAPCRTAHHRRCQRPRSRTAKNPAGSAVSGHGGQHDPHPGPRHPPHLLWNPLRAAGCAQGSAESDSPPPLPPCRAGVRVGMGSAPSLWVFSPLTPSPRRQDMGLGCVPAPFPPLGFPGDKLTLPSLEGGDAGALRAASPLGASLLTSSITCRGKRPALHPTASSSPSKNTPHNPGKGFGDAQDPPPSPSGSTRAGLCPISPCPPRSCPAATPPNLPPVLSLLPALEADDQRLSCRPRHLQGVGHLLAPLVLVGDAAAAQVQLQHRLQVSGAPEALWGAQRGQGGTEGPGGPLPLFSTLLPSPSPAARAPGR